MSTAYPTAPFEFDHVIILCCHGIWLNHSGDARGDHELEWLIEPFQIGETQTFIKHLERAVTELLKDGRAFLVISGGATKGAKTDVSEAQSYHDLAIARGMFGYSEEENETGLDPCNGRLRMFVDEYATDSFQNILFPLIQFPKYLAEFDRQLRERESSPRLRVSATQPRFPRRMTIISHAFKQKRFLELHLPAIKWSPGPEKTTYIGIDPPFPNVEKYQAVIEGDWKNGYGAWKKDLYGAQELLSKKRVARGWTRKRQEHFAHDIVKTLHGNEWDKIEALLRWEGGVSEIEIFHGRLPWDGGRGLWDS